MTDRERAEKALAKERLIARLKAANLTPLPDLHRIAMGPEDIGAVGTPEEWSALLSPSLIDEERKVLEWAEKTARIYAVEGIDVATDRDDGRAYADILRDLLNRLGGTA